MDQPHNKRASKCHGRHTKATNFLRGQGSVVKNEEDSGGDNQKELQNHPKEDVFTEDKIEIQRKNDKGETQVLNS